MSTFDLTTFFGKGIPIMLTAAMLEKIIKMQAHEHDIKVEITPGDIRIRGTIEVKKMMFKKKVSFRIIIRPVHVEKRTITFELTEMKPIDKNFINQKLFNRPPFFEYENRMIKMNLNAWSIVKKIPIGTIRSFEMVDGGMKMNLSL
ncbi:hypothetical protein GW626_20175 [Peribacillus muralis]|uniref:hypothetical protein n=1 Tax=Peribacillus muralis TaxID=264697 RepID=UPI001F4EB510|nr:hypothetical protein [Peribacillus muralis]MCK1994198.1 hypothetical protein [Peribacillus muralis]MCK2015017.1 hypothetical protein [Peribacillus muralis]